MTSKYRFVFILFSIILFFGCDKRHAKKYAGVYACEVNYTGTNINYGPWDSTYFQEVEVVQEGRYLFIGEKQYHIDSLWKGKTYTVGNYSCAYSTRFENDSLFLTISTGSLGTHTSRKYKGKKVG